jgi:hypothetical protein
MKIFKSLQAGVYKEWEQAKRVQTEIEVKRIQAHTIADALKADLQLI